MLPLHREAAEAQAAVGRLSRPDRGGLRVELPGYGIDTALDATDLKAYANGQRRLSKNGPERERYADADASWGHRSAVSTRKGGGFYGYKLHMIVCARHDLPIAGVIATAKANESKFVAPLLDLAQAGGLTPETVVMDKGYDFNFIYDECEQRNARPIIPIRKLPRSKKDESNLAAAFRQDAPPSCEHGT